jgi:hypothetical protein
MSMSADLRRLRFASATILVSLLTGMALAQQGPPLPPSPIEPKVRTACTECHDSRILLQQRLSRGTWTKEVDKMIRWGAVVDAKDRDSFIEYLSTNFPPDKAAYAPAGAKAPKR